MATDSSKNLKAASDHLAANDPVLAKIIATAGEPTIRPHKNYYWELIDSIISQQLSVKAAATIEKRFRELFDEDIPSPEAILAKSVEELRNAGLSGAKANYIRDLAMHILDNKIQFETLDQLSNQEIIDELTAVKGIGEWTAHMFMIFCMGRLDVLPVGDLGIRNGVTRLYGLDGLADAANIREIAAQNKWHPYESVASWYIWHALDNKPAV